MIFLAFLTKEPVHIQLYIYCVQEEANLDYNKQIIRIQIRDK
jgi:hypothetical protein